MSGLERTDFAAAGLFAWLWGVMALSMRQVLGTHGLAMGSDPVLWGMSAKNIQVLAPSEVPPLYPAMMGLTEALSWLPLVDAGLLVGLVGFVLIGPAVYLGSRWLGAARGWAAVVTLGLFCVPQAMQFGFQMQPDSWTALALALSGPMLGWYYASPTMRRLGGVGLYAGLVCLLREHGLPLAGLLGLATMLAPGTWAQRAFRPVFIALAVVVAPLLTGQSPGLPHQLPWMERVFQATSGSEKFHQAFGAKLDALHEAHRLAHETEDRLAILYHHSRTTLLEARVAWLWVVGGLLALPVLGRRALGAVLPLPVAFTGLILFTQSRHVDVLAPAAAVALAVGLSRHRTPLRLLTGTLLLTAVIMGGRRWPAVVGHGQLKAEHTAEEKGFAEELCARAAPTDLHAGENLDMLVYCPLRQSHLMPAASPADWHTWYIATSEPPVHQGWMPVVQVGRSKGRQTYYAYRLRPQLQGSARPCGDHVPVASTPWLGMDRVAAETEGTDCTASLSGQLQGQGQGQGQVRGAGQGQGKANGKAKAKAKSTGSGQQSGAGKRPRR